MVARGTDLKVMGDSTELQVFESYFKAILAHVEKFSHLNSRELESILESGKKTADSKSEGAASAEAAGGKAEPIVFGPSGLVVRARTPNQRKMVESITKNDILFAVGPAGTGKTYTAVALAVRALRNKEIKRIILTRPAVEAGENLGFLPGDLKEKVDPYLRPLYDALYTIFGTEHTNRLIERETIEIAPLAYMRGRTLDDAFIILDEAQNTTVQQMKMFLTRLGFGSKMVINGDTTQVDLPKRVSSGLIHAERVLTDIKGIGNIRFEAEDVIRHPLVAKVIRAYDNETDRED